MVASWPGDFLLRIVTLNQCWSSVAINGQWFHCLSRQEDFTLAHWTRPSKYGFFFKILLNWQSEVMLILTHSSILCIYQAWDLTTRQCVQTLSEHKAAVTSVLCWDEKLLSCSLDKTVKLWTLSESGNLQVKYAHAEENVRTALLPIMRYFCFVGCCRLSIPK